MPTRLFTAEDLTCLVCPACSGPLAAVFDPAPNPSGAEQQVILCTTCGNRYPILDGIPLLLAHTHPRP